MRYVRITCSPIDSSEHENIIIDAILDEAGNILGNHALFGLWGDPYNDSAGFSPFILKGDGIIAYDEAYPNEDRYFLFNLRDGKIGEGRLLKYSRKQEPSDKADYRITDIFELPEIEESGSGYPRDSFKADEFSHLVPLAGVGA